MKTIVDIPSELFLHAILPHLFGQDVLALGRTCIALYQITSDELLWEKLCEAEYDITESRLPAAHTTRAEFSWKRLYKKLAQLIMYGWGPGSSSRVHFK
jgi:hypothetical protein